MDIRELLLHLRRYPSDRAVQRATGIHRQTVKRYRAGRPSKGCWRARYPR